MMDSNLQSYFRNEILRDWTEMEGAAQPTTFWVAEHNPLSDIDTLFRAAAANAWYFDGSAFRAKTGTDYAAFMNFGAGFPGGTGRFEIGYGGFAPVLGSLDVWLYWQFGGLFGVGYLYRKQGDSYIREEMWRS